MKEDKSKEHFKETLCSSIDPDVCAETLMRNADTSDLSQGDFHTCQIKIDLTKPYKLGLTKPGIFGHWWYTMPIPTQWGLWNRVTKNHQLDQWIFNWWVRWMDLPMSSLYVFWLKSVFSIVRAKLPFGTNGYPIGWALKSGTDALVIDLKIPNIEYHRLSLNK